MACLGQHSAACLEAVRLDSLPRVSLPLLAVPGKASVHLGVSGRSEPLLRVSSPSRRNTKARQASGLQSASYRGCKTAAVVRWCNARSAGWRL